jgi:hypothetical protein
MSLKSKFSPPYVVNFLGEQTLTFKRMLMREWEELAEQVKAELIDKEAARINAELKDASTVDRAATRTRMRDYFEETITMARVIQDSANTPKGIRKLLEFALVEKDQVEWLDLVSATDANAIVSQIVYMPVVKPENPTPLPSPNPASSGGSVPDATNPSGDATPPTSSIASPEPTPAA